ncbi:MAG: dienelactone hydrolase family protein [Alkalibacterium sp.]|nr:dienelactone hydrolase family protein [Alkalibacterium sp.]
MRVITEWLSIDSIPSVLVYPEKSVSNPLVLVFHGYGNDKYEGIKLALKLSKEGFAVLCFDAYGQGDRRNESMDQVTSDSEFGMRLFKIVEKTLTDVRKIIFHLENHHAVNTHYIGLIGLSHGANSVYYINDKISDVKSSVAILGAPDFEALLIYAMEFTSTIEFKSAEEQSVLNYVQELNPYEDLKNTKVPLLMINAKNDDSVPYTIAQNLKIKETQPTNQIRELVLEEGHHFVSDIMENHAINWTKTHLVVSGNL